MLCNRANIGDAELLDEIAGGILKFVGRIFFEVVFELLVNSPGYLFMKAFSKSTVDPDGLGSVMCGLLFWATLLGVGFFFFGNFFTGDAANA